MNQEALAVKLEMESSKSGKVLLTNGGSTDLRVWNFGNSWGDDSLSFEVAVDGAKEHITRKPQLYTRNVPSSAVVAPGGKHVISFNLDDGSWEPARAVDRLNTKGVQLVALYRVSKSPEAVTHHVWTGEIRSHPAEPD